MLNKGAININWCNSAASHCFILVYSSRTLHNASSVPVWVILIMSTDDGKDVPWTLRDTTKKLYMVPVSRLEISTFVSFTVTCCMKKKKRKLWKLLNNCLFYIPIYYNELHYSFIWYLKLSLILSVKTSLPTSNWNYTKIFVKSVFF